MPSLWPPRWPSHWRKPRLSLLLAWALAVLFIWQWVWAYDACRAADDFGGSRSLCLVGSFYAQLVSWALTVWVTLIALVERIFP